MQRGDVEPAAGRAPDLVELTRRSMEATNRRELDASATMFAADAVFDVSAVGLGRFEGPEAIHGYLGDWMRAYARQTLAEWEGEDLGGGVVFVVAHFEARLLGSPRTVRERWAFTVCWRDGLIRRVLARKDIEHARADAERLAAATP